MTKLVLKKSRRKNIPLNELTIPQDDLSANQPTFRGTFVFANRSSGLTFDRTAARDEIKLKF